MTVTSHPNADYEATFLGGPPATTMFVEVKDGQGNVITARDSTNIIEQETGVYTATRIAPSTKGTYQIIWDAGASSLYEEDLVVTYSSMAVAADDFITVGDLGTSLSIAEGAALAVSAACDEIRTLTGQVLTVVTDEDIVLDGTGTDALLLPQVPVLDVTVVSENDETLVADDDYKLNGNGVLLRMPTLWDQGWSTATYRRAWCSGRQNVAVTYSHGFPEDDFPNDLKQLAIQIAKRLLQQGAGVVFESLGEYSVRYDSPSLNTAETQIISKYRRL